MIRVARASSSLYLMQDNEDEQDMSKFSFDKVVKLSLVFFVNSCKTKDKVFFISDTLG